MKKRSMLAIASLAAGVVTAIVTPPPNATAADASALGATSGLLQNDAVGELLENVGPLSAPQGLQSLGSGAQA